VSAELAEGVELKSAFGAREDDVAVLLAVEVVVFVTDQHERLKRAVM